MRHAARGLVLCLARRAMVVARRAVSPISLLVLFDSISTVLSPNPVLFHGIDCRRSIAHLNLKLLKNLLKIIKLLEDSSVFGSGNRSFTRD